MKKCIKCGKRRIDDAFYVKTYKGRVCLSGACRKCVSKQTGAYAKQNRHTLRTKIGQNRALVAKLKAGPCKDCGNSFPPICMDFDHRPGVTKIRAIAHMMGQAQETILAEIAKCDLVCSNCHRIRTASRPKKFTSPW